jgi:hypothetical protein
MAYSLFTLSGASYTNIAEHTLYELLTHNKIADIARITKTYNGIVIALYDTTHNPDVAMFILENSHHLTYLDLRILTTMNIRTAAAAEYVCGTYSPTGPCSLERSAGVNEPVVAAGPCSLERSACGGPHDGYSG